MPDVHFREEPPAWEHSRALRGMSPAQVAGFILEVGGRLLGVEGHSDSGEHVLVYTFAGAGKEQSFQAAPRGGATDSIAHIFPEAAERERELQHQFGMTFHRPADS